MCLTVNHDYKHIVLTDVNEKNRISKESKEPTFALFGEKDFYIEESKKGTLLTSYYGKGKYMISQSKYGIELTCKLQKQPIDSNYVVSTNLITTFTFNTEITANDLGMHFTHSHIDGVDPIPTSYNKIKSDYQAEDRETLTTLNTDIYECNDLIFINLPVMTFSENIQMLDMYDAIAEIIYIPTPKLYNIYLEESLKYMKKSSNTHLVKNVEIAEASYKKIYSKLLKLFKESQK